MEKSLSLKKIALENDITAEAYLASLPIPPLPTDCAILPTGSFNRGVKRDLLAIKEWNIGEEIVYRELSTSRRSIYDTLPSGIFHPNRSKLENQSNKKTKEEILEKVKKRKEEEKEAQRFFSPFDLELHLLRYVLELEESKVLVSEEMYVLFFDALWPDYKMIFNDQQKFQLFHFIPHFREIIGNKELTGQCLSLLLDLPLVIKSSYHTKKWTSPYNKTIGMATLNIDSFIGNTISETVLKWTIQIDSISSAAAEQLVPGKPNYTRLLVLLDFLFPMEIVYDIKINVKEEEQSFRLSPHKTSQTLGYSSYL